MDAHERPYNSLDDSLDAMKKLEFTDAELKEIDRHAQEGAIDIWKDARVGTG
jgi:L-glyceraldehyde 3-phosphate reductase